MILPVCKLTIRMCRPPGIGPMYPSKRSLRNTSAGLSGVSRDILLLDHNSFQHRNGKPQLQRQDNIAFDGVTQVLARLLETIPLGEEAADPRNSCDNHTVLINFIESSTQRCLDISGKR